MIESKLLKPYKGVTIDKSWEVDDLGRVKKNSTIYGFYINDEFVDGSNTLTGIHKKVDEYLA